MAILSQPPESVNGSMRVTIQGETVEQHFGLRRIAVATLERYTGAVLQVNLRFRVLRICPRSQTPQATLSPTVSPKPEWRELMEAMSTRACDTYR